MSIDVELEGGLGSFSVSGSDSLEVALNDGVLSITDDSSNSLVYDGVSQVPSPHLPKHSGNLKIQKPGDILILVHHDTMRLHVAN